MWLSLKHWGYQNCDSSPLHCFVFKDTAPENPMANRLVLPSFSPSFLQGAHLMVNFSIPRIVKSPQGSGPNVGVKTGRWRHPFGFHQEFRAGRDLVKPGEFADLLTSFRAVLSENDWVPPIEQSWNGHVWEVNHLGIRNFPWLCCWIPRGFPQNGTVKSCKNYPFWVLNMTRHCGFLGLKYGQVLWWPTPTWKQSCVEPSSCGCAAMKFIKFTALMPPEIFGKFCKCHFCMAGRHIGDICWYLVAAYCFHDPFRPFWGLSHWGVEKLERWRWKERIMRCRVSRDGTCLMSWILLIE